MGFVRLREEVLRSKEKLYDIGASVFKEGRTKFKDFFDRMKKILGEHWNRFKKAVLDVYNKLMSAVLNDRGEIGRRAYAPVFYSKLRKYVHERMPNSMRVSDFKKFLEGKVKKEEMDWSGLNEFLKGVNPDGLVRKSDILKVVRGPEIEKRVLGGKPLTLDEWYQNELKNIGTGGDSFATKEELDKVYADYKEDPSLYTFYRSGVPQFESFMISGGKNYREIAIKYPLAGDYYESHFGKDVGANVLLDDRYDKDGNKWLFIQELQSTLHERGLKEGYGNLKELPQGYKVVQKRENEFYVFKPDGKNLMYPGSLAEVWGKTEQDAINSGIKALNQDKVPDAPYKKTWHELILKQVVRIAAEEGYYGITWANGEQIAQKYNLGNYADALEYSKGEQISDDDFSDDDLMMQDFTQEEIEIARSPKNVKITLIRDGKTLTGRFIDTDKLGNWLPDSVVKEILSGGKKGKIDFKERTFVGKKFFLDVYNEKIPQFFSNRKRWNVKVSDLDLSESKGRKGALTIQAMRETLYDAETDFTMDLFYYPAVEKIFEEYMLEIERMTDTERKAQFGTLDMTEIRAAQWDNFLQTYRPHDVIEENIGNLTDDEVKKYYDQYVGIERDKTREEKIEELIRDPHETEYFLFDDEGASYLHRIIVDQMTINEQRAELRKIVDRISAMDSGIAREILGNSVERAKLYAINALETNNHESVRNQLIRLRTNESVYTTPSDRTTHSAIFRDLLKSIPDETIDQMFRDMVAQEGTGPVSNIKIGIQQSVLVTPEMKSEVLYEGQELYGGFPSTERLLSFIKNVKGSVGKASRLDELLKSELKPEKKHHKISEYRLTESQWKEVMPELRGATVHETMGPNWKDIFWSPMNRPYVRKGDYLRDQSGGVKLTKLAKFYDDIKKRFKKEKGDDASLLFDMTRRDFIKLSRAVISPLITPTKVPLSTVMDLILKNFDPEVDGLQRYVADSINGWWDSGFVQSEDVISEEVLPLLQDNWNKIPVLSLVKEFKKYMKDDTKISLEDFEKLPKDEMINVLSDAVYWNSDVHPGLILSFVRTLPLEKLKEEAAQWLSHYREYAHDDNMRDLGDVDISSKKYGVDLNRLISKRADEIRIEDDKLHQEIMERNARDMEEWRKKQELKKISSVEKKSKRTMLISPEMRKEILYRKYGMSVLNSEGKFYNNEGGFINITKLKNVGANLWDYYKRRPEFTQTKEMIGKYTGGLQVIDHELTKLAKQINKDITKDDQSAINVYMEANGDIELLKKYAATVKGPYKKMYEDAVNLSPENQAKADEFRKQFDELWLMAYGEDVIESYIENYVRHQWKDPKKAGQKTIAALQAGYFRAKPREAMERVFKDNFEGIQAGYEPVDMRIGYQFIAWQRSVRQAILAKKFLKALMKSTESDGRPTVVIGGSGRMVSSQEPNWNKSHFIKANSKGHDTRDYRFIDHPALRRWKWIGKTEDNVPIYMEGNMWIHPDAYKRMNALFGKSWFKEYTIPERVPIIGGRRPGAGMLSAGGFIKGTVLIGPFHHAHMAEHALFHKVNPFSTPEIDFDNRPVLKDLVDHGLMLYNHNAMAEFAEGLASGGIWKYVPVAGEQLRRYQEWLFQNYIPRLKAAMAEHAVDRAKGYYAKQLASGEMTMDQLLENVAMQSNAAFGEQNYKYLGRNQTLQDGLRIALLAPDFLEARLRFGGQAMRPYGREQLMALIRGAAIMFTAAQIANLLFGDEKKVYWSRPFSAIIGGREYTPRSVVGDIAHLVKDPRNFWYYRLNPLWGRPVVELASGRDEKGRKATPVEIAINTLKTWTPIPAQGLVKDTGDPAFNAIMNGLFSSVGLSNYEYQTDFGKYSMTLTRPAYPKTEKSTEKSKIVRQLKLDKEKGQKEMARALKERVISERDINEIEERALRPAKYTADNMSLEELVKGVESTTLTPKEKREVAPILARKLNQAWDDGKVKKEDQDRYLRALRSLKSD
jgi:hypothetical protein